ALPIYYPAFEQSIRRELEERLAGKADFEFTGILAMMGETFNKLLPSLVQSYLMSFVLITLMMIIFVESFRLGLISMIPNTAPVIMTLALMVIAGFPLRSEERRVGKE